VVTNSPHKPKAGTPASQANRRAISGWLLYIPQSLFRDGCRICGVTLSGFAGYISHHHRNLMLARYGIICSNEEAQTISLGAMRGQRPATRIKYKDAIEACRSPEFIEFNVSQIARMFGLNLDEYDNRILVDSENSAIFALSYLK